MAASSPGPTPSKPRALQHLSQARHNHQLCQELKGRGEYLDWAVTLLFYTALHLVQAYFIEVAATEADIPRDHPERDSAIWRTLPHIANQYAFLKTRSTWARYALERPKPTPELLNRYESEQFALVLSELGKLGLTL